MADITAQPAAHLARANGLGEILRRSAARYRHKAAIVDGDVTFTFREFDSLVDRVAAGLAGHGIGKGDRLALISRNSWSFAALAWGCARLGAILVPLNFMLNDEDIAYILDHSEPKAVAAQPEFRSKVEQALNSVSSKIEMRIILDSDGPGPERWRPIEDFMAPVATGYEFPPVDDDDPIRLMYTSGTESRPKGAVLSSRALQAEYLSCIIDGGMTSDDVDLHTLPLYHCAQLDCFLGPDLMLGATSVILPSPDPATILRTIAEKQITKYFAPPTVWIALLCHPDFDRTDLSSLRKGYYGASPMPVEILKEIQERLPNVDLWNFYGQTELAPVATILPPDEQISYAGSAGRPALFVETRVVDDDGREVPIGEVGEVVHRSPQATLGYWRDPEKTREAFRDGWFHSGDLGVMDKDGRLAVVDRKKDMIKTGGENVASREVEEAIYLHPDVAEVAVFATPHHKWVEAVTAAVVPKPGSTLTPANIDTHCAAHLSSFKRPKRVEIVDTLPKNPTGKVLKRELRKLYS